MAALVLVLTVAVSACAPQAADQSAELAALTDSWENALNAGDVDALAALYAEHPEATVTAGPPEVSDTTPAPIG